MNGSEVLEFELKATDLAGRVGRLKTKTSRIETPALLPVVHPARQLVPCEEIRAMGYEAVMTNAYTTFRHLRNRASEGIHRIIDFKGTVMTDSGGYQVLEFGSVDIKPEEMAKFEEEIGSDIAVILDRPTGLDVTRRYAEKTVRDTLLSAKKTKEFLTRKDIAWMLPIQGGKYLDLVSKSAKSSALLDFDVYALGSPVEVMKEYDFSLLVKMICSAKARLPVNKPFHLFGAGHTLIIPLAIALGCDLFDSASYMLYAKQDRYISPTGTIRVSQLDSLPCVCKVCSSLSASELRQMKIEERTILLARHNLLILKQQIEQAKQAIWEGRLWEFINSNSRNHPKVSEAFRLATIMAEKEFELGTPSFKERGIFIFDMIDLQRPEIVRFREKLSRLNISRKKMLLVLPETKSKPFLASELYKEISKLVSFEETLVTFLCPNFGLVPAEISDIFPLSQFTSSLEYFPINDAILRLGNWRKIHALLTQKNAPTEKWVMQEIEARNQKITRSRNSTPTEIVISRSYKSFKKKLS